VEAPYIKKKATKPYTLVLDLDETLIHFDDSLQSASIEQAINKFVQKQGRQPVPAELKKIMPPI
jgi:predicted HAD superfamily phosphohydrolase YqeG